MSNTNDRELLELAAKAAGIEHMRWCGPAGLSRMLDPTRPDSTGSIGGYWNPLTDSGQALELAVKLHICTLFPMTGATYPRVGAGQVGSYEPACMEPHDPDPYAATRRAITRAAAEIGRTAPAGG